MKIKPTEDSDKPISLSHLTLEEALKLALKAPVEPNEPRKPGAGRKKKQTPQEAS